MLFVARLIGVVLAWRGFCAGCRGRKMRARWIVVCKRCARSVPACFRERLCDVSGRLPLYMFTVLYFVMLLQAATDSQLAD